MRCRRKWAATTFEVVAINVDTGDDTKPRKFLADTGVDALGYYRENTLDLFNDVKTRGLALGLPVTLLVDGRRLPAGSYEWPGRLGRRRRQAVSVSRNG